jgi:hypothetical protein
MAGVLEEGAKVAGSVVDAMRGSPLAIANIILYIAFLIFLFYYVSINATRAQNTVREMFQAQDNLYKQWSVIIQDTNKLTEKAMHCLLPEDALKLLQLPPRYAPPLPEAPVRPQNSPLQHLLPGDRRTELEPIEVPHVLPAQTLEIPAASPP